MKSITATAICALSLSVATFGAAMAGDSAAKMESKGKTTGDLKLIDTVVVIYAENRSFDNLYGSFPGANGLSKAAASAQIGRAHV